MRKHIVYIMSVVALFLLTGGCAVGQTTLKENNMSNRTLKPLRYHILRSGEVPADPDEYMHGKRAYEVYHTDDPKEMEAFVKSYRRLTGEAPPEVSGTIIVAKFGTRNTGGYGFEIRDIRDEGRVVKVVLAPQKPSGMVTQAFTNPWMVILLPDLHKEIEVVEEE